MKHREELRNAAVTMAESQEFPDGPFDDVTFLETCDRIIEQVQADVKADAVSFVEHYDSYVATKLKEHLK